MIAAPEVNPSIPRDFYVSNLTMPKIQMRIDAENRSRIADPNVEMYVAWLNTVKKIIFEYHPKKDKFEATTQFTKDLGGSFIVGLNTCMIKERYIFCEFFHQP